MKQNFKIESEYKPAGDQPTAIAKLVDGLRKKEHNQVLLGVTGSGKTFTMAHVIEQTQRPAMIMAHNKTLASQIYSEMKSFFPASKVEYFVSYYDYYQPEAYVAKTDTFIEKDSSINEQIDRMRHSATRSLLESPENVIVVSSVSCIYGIGSAETYSDMTLNLKVNGIISRSDFLKKLVELQYERNDIDFKRGTFRVRGDSIDLFPAHLEDQGWRISLFGDEIESIIAFDSLTGNKMNDFESVNIFANSHYVTPRPTIERAIATIKAELKERLEYYHSIGRVLEAQRIEQRTVFDLEMMMETGSCKGIENYSRHLTGSTPGAPPPTLFQYLPKNAILFIDESHVTVPQIGGMYNGDFARKSVLKEHGFRLPSCLDNRPLKFEEWDNMRPDTIFVSATPGKYEMEHGRSSFAEQIIRPTGLIDPPCFIKPIATQVDDLLMECREKIKEGQRVLVTTLTKRMSEELSDYMQDAGIKVCYLHSDIDTMERVEIIRDLRLGKVDVLVGVNLLREGLDIPECGLVAILDADKEGFLRSETSLIQTIGRAARNINSKVILYADKITRSMQAALSETERRRKIQSEYNEKHGITPTSIQKSIHEVMQSPYEQDHYTIKTDNDYSLPKFDGKNVAEYVEKLHAKMLKAASDLEFEEAARLRNEIDKLQKNPSRDIKTPQNSARSKRKR